MNGEERAEGLALDGFGKRPDHALIVREAAELAVFLENAAAEVKTPKSAGSTDAPEETPDAGTPAPATGSMEDAAPASREGGALGAAGETAPPEEETRGGEHETLHSAICEAVEEHAAGTAEPGVPARTEEPPQVSGGGEGGPAEEQPQEPVRALTNEEVTEHTAGLWKYFPVPDTEPEPMPEYLSSTLEYPGSRIIAARVRGKKHKHEGTNCDDWYETAHYGDITFIAVADGAGSKKFSRVGARESCRAAVGYLVKTFGETLAAQPSLREAAALPLADATCIQACGTLARVVQQSVVKAGAAVEAAYYSRAADPAYTAVLKRDLEFKDLSATLLLAVLIPMGKETKERLVITCQIGDGMIALLDTAGEFASSLKLMGKADSGDFSGETEFLTSPQMKQLETLQSRTKISRSAADLVFVMTDGVSDDYFPNETELRRLYFDLVVNGVLPGKDAAPGLTAITPEQVRLLRRLPEAPVYPWVNDREVQVAVQYTRRICEAVELSMEEIWRDSAVLSLAGTELAGRVPAENAGERLKIWLDNYVERGSFDDRTLVIAQM